MNDMTSPPYEDTISPSVPLGLAQTLSALNNSRGEEMEGEVANEMEEIETDDDIPVYSRVHIKVNGSRVALKIIYIDMF